MNIMINSLSKLMFYSIYINLYKKVPGLKIWLPWEKLTITISLILFFFFRESVVYRYTYTTINIIKHKIRTSMNERTHFFIKIYISHFILERVYICCVWLISWIQGYTAILTLVLLTIAATLSHFGRVAQPWVTKGSKPSVCSWFSIRPLLQLTRTVCASGYIIV